MLVSFPFYYRCFYSLHEDKLLHGGNSWNNAFGNNIVFSLESYSTKTRCTGLGIGLSFMLLGGVVSYFIQQYLKPYSVAIIIFVYFSTSVMGFLLVMYLPTEEIKSDLGYVGEVMVEKKELLSIHHGPEELTEIEKKLLQRKHS